MTAADLERMLRESRPGIDRIPDVRVVMTAVMNACACSQQEAVQALLVCDSDYATATRWITNRQRAGLATRVGRPDNHPPPWWLKLAASAIALADVEFEA